VGFDFNGVVSFPLGLLSGPRNRLGTVNTVVHVRGRGIVLNEPSVVALETVNGIRRVAAVGRNAKLMMGKPRTTSRRSDPCGMG
jgi:actin-like ATPase involved in cell morphogenesis